MTKQIVVCNVQDFKDENGLWVKSYSPEPYLQQRTRAGVLWNSVNQRCKVGGNEQRKRPSYIGCTNGFKDFQEFAEWCQSQYGYLNKEQNGMYWQLDKDLKVFGNKGYSPDTCVFVPNRVNSLLITPVARSEYPTGVYWDNHKQRYKSNCSDGSGKQRTLGRFYSTFEAHQAWQKYKVELIRKICVEDEEIRNHLELVPILLAQAQRIEDDLLNNRETT